MSLTKENIWDLNSGMGDKRKDTEERFSQAL